MFGCHIMRAFLFLAAFGLGVAAIALPPVPGAEIISTPSYNTTSTPQSAPPSTSNYRDYGPDVVYAKPWPTSVTTTATPHTTSIASLAQHNIAEPTQARGSENHGVFFTGDFFNTPFEESIKVQAARPSERLGSEPTKGLDNSPHSSMLECPLQIPNTCEGWSKIIDIRLEVLAEMNCFPPDNCINLPISLGHGNSKITRAVV